jgi:hypothetical protein
MSEASDGSARSGVAKARDLLEGFSGQRDFVGEPVYLAALQLCAVVFDLEPQFPDDERDVLYSGMRRAVVEAGSLVAAGFGRSPGPAREDLWERARSRLMEARHYVLLAQMRYVLDTRGVDAFEAVYFEALKGIGGLLEIPAGSSGGARVEGD